MYSNRAKLEPIHTLLQKIFLMSNVPIVTTWYTKCLNRNSRVHHTPVPPFEIRKRTDCMQYANFKTVYIANLVVNINSSAILEPVIQPRAWWFCQWYQKGSLPFLITFVPINLVHLIEVAISVRIIEPVPEKRGENNLDGRETHVLHLSQGTRISQNDGIGIDIEHTGINARETRTEFFTKHFGYLSSLFGKVEAIIALAPFFSVTR